MNVDDAMETAAAYLAANKHEKELLFFSESVAITLAAEVERLRAELAEAKAENVGLEEGHDRLAAEVERLRAELAKAKAASACPVAVVAFEPDYEQTVTVALWTNADGQRFADWLNDRIKERGER